MSLGEQLADPKAPLTLYLAARLPHARSVAAEESVSLTILPTLRPDPEAPHRVLAKAILYRVRFDLASPPVRTLPAWRHALTLALRHGEQVQVATEDLFDQLESFLAQIEPVGRRLEMRNEETLNRYCLVLARLEVLGEQGGGEPEHLLHALCSGGVLGTLPRDWIEDLQAVSRSFHAQRYLFLGQAVDLAPRMSGDDLAGAEEDDILVGSCLLTLRSTVHPEVDERHLLRLVARALLDLDDAHEIREVAVYLSRQGKLLRYPLEELLARLGFRGGLAALRYELRAHLEQAYSEPIPISRATGQGRGAEPSRRRGRGGEHHPEQLRFSFG